MVEQIVQCCFSLFGGGHGRRREDGGGKCVGAWVVLVVETGREGMVVLIHGEDILGGFLKRGQVPSRSSEDIEDFNFRKMV